MTDGFTLGIMPEPLRVVLTQGADFKATIRLTGDTWPVGTTVSLVIAGDAWDATLDGTDAVWDVDKAVCDLVPNSSTAKLTYTNGDDDEVWAIGTVVRFDG